MKKRDEEAVAPAASGAPPMLMSTTDTIPAPYQIVGLVSASRGGLPFVSATGQMEKSIALLWRDLAASANAMGANGVIGIRVTLSMVGAPYVMAVGTAIRYRTE